MNMMIFHNQLRKVFYSSDSWLWDIDDYIQFFDLFFVLHKKKTGYEHFNIPSKKLSEIMDALPFVIDENENAIDLDMDDYKLMLLSYFNTDLDCDYSIYHFMSGDIRLYRTYEMYYK